MLRIIAIFVTAIVLSGCAPTYVNHGYAPADALLESIRLGVDRKVDVERKIGSPLDDGFGSGEVWYYLSSRVENFAYRAPEVVDRRLVAVRFNTAGIAQSIGITGSADGRDIPLTIRTTETFGQEVGFFEQLFGNILNPGLPE
ncbi:MAG: outer membrane protein assembly factor BamE [Pseudomonadota bacterium]